MRRNEGVEFISSSLDFLFQNEKVYCYKSCVRLSIFYGLFFPAIYRDVIENIKAELFFYVLLCICKCRDYFCFFITVVISLLEILQFMIWTLLL